MRPSPVIAQPGQGFASRQRQVRGAKRVGNTGVAWPGAVPLALGLYFLLGLRLHEVVPGIHVLRLPFVMLIVALPLIYTKTKGKAFGYLWANKTFRYAALFSCWCVASVPGSVGRPIGGGGAGPHPHPGAGGGLPPLSARQHHDFRRVQEGMVAGAAVLGSLVVVLGRATGGRAKVSTSLDPNDIAAILAFSIPLAVGLLYSPKFRHRVVGLGSLGALFAGLAVTSSRGTIVALGAATVVLVAAQSAKRQAALIVVLVVCGFGLWTYAPPTFRERMTSLGTLDNDYNTYEYSGRSNLWKRGMGYVATNPVLGVGMSAFGIAEGKKLESMGERGQWLTAHNTYLQVAAGVDPGFILSLLLREPGAGPHAHRLCEACLRRAIADSRSSWLRGPRVRSVRSSCPTATCPRSTASFVPGPRRHDVRARAPGRPGARPGPDGDELHRTGRDHHAGAGAPWLLRHPILNLAAGAARLHPRHLLIVCYHGLRTDDDPEDWLLVHVADFRAQLEWLSAHYHVLPLDEGVSRLAAGTLPGPTACITFDDGYRNNLTLGLPLLRRLGSPRRSSWPPG